MREWMMEKSIFISNAETTNLKICRRRGLIDVLKFHVFFYVSELRIIIL